MSEGNECYKFSFMKSRNNFYNEDFYTIIDIGANVGTMTKMIRHVFPNSFIYSFEAVDYYYNQLKSNTKGLNNIFPYCRAVTYDHLNDKLFLYKHKKNDGGSIISVDVDNIEISDKKSPAYRIKNSKNIFIKTEYKNSVETLDEIVNRICQERQVEEIDYIKFDCEGSEISIFENVSAETLNKIKYMSGEYHASRSQFFDIIKNKMSLTHRCSAGGLGDLGTFFFERKDIKDGIVEIRDNNSHRHINNFNKKWAVVDESLTFKKYFSYGDYHWDRFNTNKYNYKKNIYTILGMIYSNIENLDQKTILDIGCGDGVFAGMFGNKFKKVICVDNSTLALEYLKNRTKEELNIKLINDNIFNVVDKIQDVDITIMIDFIEHLCLSDFLKLLKNIKTKYLFILTPLKEKQGKLHDKKYHIYEYFENELKTILKNENYKEAIFFNDKKNIFCLYEKG